jgi:hypothetical protein
MSSYEKRKPKSVSDEIRDPATHLSEAQRLKTQQLSGLPGDDSPGDPIFDNSASHCPAAVSDMSPFSSLPAELEGENTFAFYPSGSDPCEAHLPTLADAVVEHMHQAQLRRRRPH